MASSRRIGLVALSAALLEVPALSGQAPSYRAASLSAPPELARMAEQSKPAWQKRLLTALGGGLIGAGAGFFASQVAVGDWDDGPNGSRVDRPTWAALGGSLGIALGFSFPGAGRASVPRAGEVVDRLLITGEEVHRAKARDAYEAVRVLRPQWLVVRGTHLLYETAADRIKVYIDHSLLGGVERLREIPGVTVESIRFLDAAAATARWGAGHSHGAILVVTTP